MSEDRRLRFCKAQSWRLMMTERSISSGVQSLCLMMIEHSIFSEVQSWRLNGDIWGSRLVLCVSLVNTRSWPISRLKGEQSAKTIFSCATDSCIAACLQDWGGKQCAGRHLLHGPPGSEGILSVSTVPVACQSFLPAPRTGPRIRCDKATVWWQGCGLPVVW